MADKNSIPNLNETQIKGCVSYKCKEKIGMKECPYKTGNRSKIRNHVRGFHGAEAPLRESYEVVYG